MKCPKCGGTESKVIDSRPVEENNSIRRRRECMECKLRFTTYEVIDIDQPFVLKKNGTKELFDKNKLLTGLLRACHKRPVDAEAVANEIEYEILNSMKHEIDSHVIGEMVMEKLRKIDSVAYVRFASVHKEFTDLESFTKTITEYKSNEKN